MALAEGSASLLEVARGGGGAGGGGGSLHCRWSSGETPGRRFLARPRLEVLWTSEGDDETFSSHTEIIAIGWWVAIRILASL